MILSTRPPTRTVRVYGACLVLFSLTVIVFYRRHSWTVPDYSIVAAAPMFQVKDVQICSYNLYERRGQMSKFDPRLKMIYFVTPTYPRPEQIPELIRLSQTLMHVPRIHWIIADDTKSCSESVSSIVKRSGLPFTYLLSPKPIIKPKSSPMPRGVSNRRAAIRWVKRNAKEGILYFGDDDNTYDLELFDEMRKTKKLAMWPVGLIGRFGVSSPIVRDGKVIGFFDSWPAKRYFAVDMAGFAVDLKFVKGKIVMPYISGREEDLFLLSLGFKLEDIEPLANNCTQVLVWHTKTLGYSRPILRMSMEKINSPRIQNMYPLINELLKLEVVSVDPVNGTTAGFITCIRDKNQSIHANI